LEVDKMILGVQILGILFGAFLLYLTFVHSKKKEFTTKEYIFWSLVWVCLIAVSVFPNSLDFLIGGLLDINRRLDFFIIVGFLFLTGVVFHTYSIVRKNQQKVEEIVRKIAIEKAEKKK
jgi:hypothetical protein